MNKSLDVCWKLFSLVLIGTIVYGAYQVIFLQIYDLAGPILISAILAYDINISKRLKKKIGDNHE